jgi:branched-chain amino acid transport system permease protein
MERFVDQAADGIINGSIYAFVALGLVLIFRSSGVVNFAQGELAMFATYAAWELTERGSPMWLALTGVALVSFVAGAAVERTLIRPVQAGGPLAIVIVTIGLLIALNSLAGWMWEFIGRPVPNLFPFGAELVDLPGGARVTGQELTIVGVLAAVVGALHLLLHHSRVGLAMRAVAFDRTSARLVGIRVERLLMLGWGLAAVVGSLAGALVAPKLTLAPNMMIGVLIYAFAAATLGGFDSVLGAVVGGIVVGLAESLGATYLPFVGSDLKLVVPVGIILLVLAVRPAGLFGSTAAERA